MRSSIRARPCCLLHQSGTGNPSVSTANNRISAAGYSFDSSGNTTRDASDRKFTYDAENKQTKVESLAAGTNTVTGTVGTYVYDGDGKRVKKYVPSTGETTVFVYDASGKLVAEYSTIVANSTDAKVSYLTSDHLGSPRINTDQNGAIIARHDYMPFGEEIDGTGGRTTGLGYGDDSVRKQFTGYERDNETELDYAQARMYGNSHGRFTSPDPYGGNLLGPQSLNKYSYVGNNPLVFIDPTGLECAEANRGGDGDQCIWVSNGQGLYESLWQSQFKQGNDLFDNGYQTIDPNTVDPFRLNNINNNAANPNNASNLANLQGQLVTLGENGEFISYEEGVITVDSSDDGERGFSIGITIGGNAGAGIGYLGGGGEVSVSELLFITNRGIRYHGYFEYGGAVNLFGHCGGIPSQAGCPAVYGAFAGVSAGPTVSNATRSEQIEGPFQSINAGITPGSVNIQASPETWVFTPSISAGPGVGGYGNLTTNTVRLPDLDPIKAVVNSVPKLPPR